MPQTLEQLAALRGERAEQRVGQLLEAESRLARQRQEYGEERRFLQQFVQIAALSAEEQEVLARQAEQRLNDHVAREAYFRDKLAFAQAELASERAALQASRAEGRSVEAALQCYRAQAASELAAMRGQLAAEEEGFQTCSKHIDVLSRALEAERISTVKEKEAAYRSCKEAQAAREACEALATEAAGRSILRQASWQSMRAEAAKYQELADRERTLLQADGARQMCQHEAFVRRCLARRHEGSTAQLGAAQLASDSR